MTKAVQKTGNPTAALVNSREDALKKLVGADKIAQFMGNVMAELRPVNAQGQPNKLLKCDPASFYAACHQAAGLRLMPGPLRECSLVPYGKTATLIVEYRGYVALAQRHPDVLKVSYKCVYEDDDFIHDLVTDAIHHQRPQDADMSDEKLVGAWCRVLLRDCPEPAVLYMTRAEIDKRKKNSNFWRDWYPEMCVKTVVRKLLNSGAVPRSTELAKVIERDIQEERKAEILAEKSERPTHVATEVQVGFEEPEEDADSFGLGEPERAHDDRSDLLQQITKQAMRLKLKPSQVLEVASSIEEREITDLADEPISVVQSVLAELEVR
jgi:recombination protein RecT